MTSLKRDYELSLNDLCGEAIVVDVFGVATEQFDLDEPLFQITRILLRARSKSRWTRAAS